MEHLQSGPQSFKSREASESTFQKLKDIVISKRERSPARKKVERTVGSVLLFSALAVGASDALTGSPTVGIREGVGLVTQQEEGSEISEDRLKYISQILAKPDEPTLIKIIKGKTKDSPEYRQYISVQAQKYGLHLVEYDQYKDRIQNAISEREVFTALNDYTSQYGFSVELVRSQNKIDNFFLGAEPIKDEVKLDEMRVGGVKLMQAFYPIPTELVKVSGLKKIKIQHSLMGPFNIYAKHPGAIADVVRGNMFIDLNQFKRGDVYPHELSHGIDARFNGGVGGMLRDRSQLRKLNPSSFRYGDRTSDGIGTVVLNEYAKNLIIEDKCEFYERIIDGIEPEIFYPRSSVIQEKSILLTARLEEEVPNITNYLRSISLKS